MQYSPSFEREGDIWRLRLKPIDSDGDVWLHLELASKDRRAGYSVARCFRLRVLHPTDASLTRLAEWDPPKQFTLRTAWGSCTMLIKNDVNKFLHKGFVTLQAVVWKPPL